MNNIRETIMNDLEINVLNLNMIYDRTLLYNLINLTGST